MRVVKVPCYVNEIWREAPKGRGWLPVEPTYVIRGLEFSVSASRRPGRRKKLEVEWCPKGQWFNQSCLCNEASIKPQNDGVRRVYKLVNTWIFGENGMLVEGSKTLPHTLPIHLAVPELYPFLINQSPCKWNVFLSFVSCSSKQNPRRRSLKPPIYSQLARSPGNNLGLQLASEGDEGAVWWDWACNLWDLVLPLLAYCGENLTPKHSCWNWWPEFLHLHKRNTYML